LPYYLKIAFKPGPALVFCLLWQVVGPACPLSGAYAQEARYAEISWEQLRPVPDEDRPGFSGLDLNDPPDGDRPFFPGLNVKDLADNDPRALEALEEYLAGSQNASANMLLQGKSVKLRGFVVPLERERGSGLKEFLLVPYFGACIHTPPPPSNQIVHVTLEQPVEDIESMDTVAVYGRISVTPGFAEAVRTGYAMQADRVEPDTLGKGAGLVLALALTIFCGLTVCLGGIVALAVKKVDERLFCPCFSFAAGVILCLGFSIPLADARRESAVAFLAGAALMAGAGFFLHKRGGGFGHTGELSALAIAAHNLPEGFAVFSAALVDPVLGIALGGAMIAHNIPLGIAIALPIRYSSQSRFRAFGYTLLSGFAPFMGAILGYAALRPFFSPDNLKLQLSGMGGVMVSLAIMELLPSARRYGKTAGVFRWLCAGVLVMLLPLLFTRQGG
jgi:ZIP family zinc transporter